MYIHANASIHSLWVLMMIDVRKLVVILYMFRYVTLSLCSDM